MYSFDSLCINIASDISVIKLTGISLYTLGKIYTTLFQINMYKRNDFEVNYIRSDHMPCFTCEVNVTQFRGRILA